MGITQDFFDSYAYDFDALYGAPQNILSSVINPLFRKSMKLRFEKTIEYSAPVDGKSILDIGCGPGHYAIALSKSGAKNVVGIDFAPEMIKIAKEKSQMAGNDSKMANYGGVQSSWSAGTRFVKLIAGQSTALGLAYGENTSVPDNLKTEQIMEIYARRQLNNWTHISPHLQLV
jgi:SAM-dependent methyltransferase